MDYGYGGCQPVALDRALAKRVGELSDIKIRGVLILSPLAVIDADPNGEVFTYKTWHFGAYDRKLAELNRSFFIPMAYRHLPLYYRSGIENDVAFLGVTPMDRHGYFNFSIANSASRACLETAKTVVLEVNQNLPRALGGREECIHISEVDWVVEGDHLPVKTLPPIGGKRD